MRGLPAPDALSSLRDTRGEAPSPSPAADAVQMWPAGPAGCGDGGPIGGGWSLGASQAPGGRPGRRRSGGALGGSREAAGGGGARAELQAGGRLGVNREEQWSGQVTSL